MELRHLRYFVAVAEELHFGKAAKRLAITQPPLSFNIAKLEETLGYALLVRSTREVSLTPAGAVFYREACRILSLAAQAKELGKRVATGEAGSLRIGFVGAAMLTPIGAALHRFDVARPELLVTVHELNSFEQLHALQREQIDFGILHPREVPEGVRTRSLYREHFVCALPAVHPLAAQAEIELGALRQESFVLFPRHFSPEYHDRIVAMCVNAGFTPNIRYEVRANATVAALVAAGFGVAILPASVKRVAIDGLAFRPLAHSSAQSELVGVWREADDAGLIAHLLQALTGLSSNSP